MGEHDHEFMMWTYARYGLRACLHPLARKLTINGSRLNSTWAQRSALRGCVTTPHSRNIGTKSSRAHREQRLVSFTVPQVKQVVIDVHEYSQFVPCCVESVITARGPDWFEAELSVGTWLFVEKFKSHVSV